MTPGQAWRLMMPDYAPAGALDPDHQHRPQSGKRAHDRGAEQGEDGQLDSEERTHYCHQLDIAETHALAAARPQINRSRTVEKRRSFRTAHETLQQRKPVIRSAGCWLIEHDKQHLR